MYKRRRIPTTGIEPEIVAFEREVDQIIRSQDLYEPVLEGFAVNSFTLRGYERLDTSEGPIGLCKNGVVKTH